MVSRVVSVVLVCLCGLVTTDKNDCKSIFCFKFLSRRIDIKINFFNNTKPIPIEDYIKQFGYPLETHEIKTEDGYILKYHRIPYGNSSSKDTTVRRPPVLLQHGLLGVSSVWVLAQDALGYLLADAGFDVWLGNGRGNTYSRNHVKYDPDKDKSSFWDFSWHEMGYYDLPASIDYILNTTNNKQLFYIGHSMGTTMYFVLGATRPEYMSKVQAMVAMAPVAFPWNIRSPLTKFFSRLHTVLNWVAKVAGIYEVFPYSDFMLWMDNNICSWPQSQFICRDVMYYIGGFSEKELKRTPISTVLQYMPAGASFKQLKHFRQIAAGTDFNQFDYGSVENIWKYGSFSPPTYNLSEVTSPIYVHYATNDWLAVPEDVHHAVEHLPNVQSVRKVPDEDFNHLDFMWANDAKTLLYEDIISTLHNLTSNQEK